MCEHPGEPGDDLRGRRAAVLVRNLDRDDRRAGRDADRPGAAVPGDDVRHRRAVTLVVLRAAGAVLLGRSVRAAVGRNEAVLGDDRARDARVVEVDAGVEQGDGHACARVAERARCVGVDERVARNIRARDRRAPASRSEASTIARRAGTEVGAGGFEPP